MITISSALKKQEIINLFSENVFEGILFTFVKTEGINMFFEVNTEHLEDAVRAAKVAIRDTDFGVGLFFRVAYEGRNH